MMKVSNEELEEVLQEDTGFHFCRTCEEFIEIGEEIDYEDEDGERYYLCPYCRGEIDLCLDF